MPRIKQHKSANGLGTVRKKYKKRKDGTEYEFWEARVTIGKDENGKQIQKSYYGKTQTEVIEKIKTVGIDVPDFKGHNYTVAEWLDIWVANYLSAVKPSSAYVYERDVELYIKPSLGKIRLSELTSLDIQTFYNSLQKPRSENRKPLASKSIRDIHGVLHQALQQAVESGEIESNPSSSCKIQKAQQREIKPLDEEQLKLFFKLIEGHPHEYFYKIAVFTGLREGELLGLTWDCVDFNNSSLLVKQQLRKDQRKGGQYYLSSPKNGKRRIVKLAPSVVDLFRLQREKQIKMMMSASSWADKGFVFTNSEGDILSYRTVYDCFKRVVKKMYQPDIRVHDLRHTYAVLSLKSGDPIKTVQENLGHASASFTLDVYGHVTEQMRQESADRMEAVIRGLSIA